MNDPIYEHVTLSLVDWIAVALFLAFVIGTALKIKFRQRGSEDFFLAGRSMGWIVVTFSLFATLFSTISFVSVPGEAYKHGLLMSLVIIAYLLSAPLGILIFLRFFFMTKTFTAYEYLEQRFNVKVRLVGSVLYCIIRLFYAGSVFYAASTVFESLVGWPQLGTIVIVGIFTIAYTATGGMKAVMYTDVVQGIVIIVSIAVILYKMLAAVSFDGGAIYSFAAEHGHGFESVATREFFELGKQDRLNFWILLMAILIGPAVHFAADQLVVQRLLASKGYAGAKKAVIFNACTGVPVVAMLWFIGIGLYYYYNAPGSATLPESVSVDQVLGYFINTELPSPFPGLIVAGLLAALMSTIDSAVNSIGNVVYRDWLVRLRVVHITGDNDKEHMLLCRILSVLAGIVAVTLATFLVYADKNTDSTVMEVASIWGSLWGVLVMSFILGVFVPRVSALPMLIGTLLGAACNLYIPFRWYYAVPAEERLSFHYLGWLGMAVALFLPLLLSIIMPNTKRTENLTLWTLTK